MKSWATAYQFTIATNLTASPQEFCIAWLSSVGHTAMTGGIAQVDPVIGWAYTAWNGYINGETLAPDPDKRIKQIWRTLNFAPSDPDAVIENLLERVENGTFLTLVHSNVPMCRQLMRKRAKVPMNTSRPRSSKWPRQNIRSP